MPIFHHALALTLLVLLATALGPGRLEALDLALPVACEPGRTCHVQNYQDHEPGDGARDFTCGEATYDGHKGTDIRVLSLEAATAGVAVLAAAPGQVRGVRDGMAERFVATPADLASLKGRECGNGVVIDHGGGWETQYCHLRRGSIAVRQGQPVAAGTPLGLIGASGNTQFAHVHFEVRKDGEPVDPFLGAGPAPACAADGVGAGAPDARPLWRPEVLASLGRPASVLLETGFAGDVLDTGALEVGHAQIKAADARAPRLLFFARFMHLQAGDRVRLVVTGPGGEVVSAPGEPLTRAKAVALSYAGRKRPATGWPPGTYVGRATLLRAGAEVLSASSALTLGP